MNHVFLGSTTPLTSWQPIPNNEDFGYYHMALIKKQKILLIKSNRHLDEHPYIEGLFQLTKAIIKEASPNHMFSIGTAGAGTISQHVGDVVITNSALLKLKKRDNLKSRLSDKLFVSKKGIDSIPALAKLMSSKQLINLSPDKSHSPQVFFSKKPLCTTDYFSLGNTHSNFAAYEMDDAALLYIAKQHNVPFTSIRNISDAIPPTKTPQGEPLGSHSRKEIASRSYKKFAPYSSVNGALVTVAAIASLT